VRSDRTTIIAGYCYLSLLQDSVLGLTGSSVWVHMEGTVMPRLKLGRLYCSNPLGCKLAY